MNTEDEKRITAQVVDRIRGGPLKRMEEVMRMLSQYDTLPVSAFLEDIKKFLMTGRPIDSNFEEIKDLDRFWADYELLTGEVVSASSKNNSPIECCA